MLNVELRVVESCPFRGIGIVEVDGHRAKRQESSGSRNLESLCEPPVLVVVKFVLVTMMSPGLMLVMLTGGMVRLL